ncbi:MAG: hypothetical protein ABI832_12420 [bacterium]
MARVILTDNLNNLSDWVGRLFEADAGANIDTHTKGTFAFTYSNGQSFAGYTVTIKGAGFQYFHGDPVGGTMKSVVVADAQGQTVITIDQIAAKGLASDLSQFVSDIFGARTATGDGPNPSGPAAWSHILSGNDTIIGSNGNDRQGLPETNGGNDVFNMGDGDDRIAGSSGSDAIFGGNGYDQLTFKETTYETGYTAFQGINLDVTAGKLTDCWGFVDHFTSIESFEGSRFNDVFKGSDGRDEFSGLRGRDAFYGGGGSNDSVVYDNDYWQGGNYGITVDLQKSLVNGSIHGTIRDGFGQLDQTYDIERVTGTRFNDVFVGSTENNQFSGGEGKDFYNGDAGFDTVNFGRTFTDAAMVGIVVDLSKAKGQIINDGFFNTETAKSIEAISGSWLDDKIKGNGQSNYIEGGDGKDTMTGGGGNDYFGYYDSFDFGDGDVITDFKSSGAAGNIDVLEFGSADFAGMTTTLHLVNGAAATEAVGSFVFKAANHTLYWDEDGTGAAAMVSVATLNGVTSLTADNIHLELG